MYTVSFGIFHNSLSLVSIEVNLGKLPFESVQSDNKATILKENIEAFQERGKRDVCCK